TRSYGDWSSDVCSSDLPDGGTEGLAVPHTYGCEPAFSRLTQCPAIASCRARTAWLHHQCSRLHHVPGRHMSTGQETRAAEHERCGRVSASHDRGLESPVTTPARVDLSAFDTV